VPSRWNPKFPSVQFTYWYKGFSTLLYIWIITISVILAGTSEDDQKSSPKYASLASSEDLSVDEIPESSPVSASLFAQFLLLYYRNIIVLYRNYVSKQHVCIGSSYYKERNYQIIVISHIYHHAQSESSQSVSQSVKFEFNSFKYNSSLAYFVYFVRNDETYGITMPMSLSQPFHFWINGWFSWNLV